MFVFSHVFLYKIIEKIIKKTSFCFQVAIVVGGLKEVCVGTEDKVDTLYLLKRLVFWMLDSFKLLSMLQYFLLKPEKVSSRSQLRKMLA